MNDLIIRQAMAEKLKSDSSLKLDQSQVDIKRAKRAQARSYTSKRKGYCKALPMAPFTPTAKNSRWAVMAVGTDASFNKTCSRLDAKHKSSTMPDPVTMSELNRKIALERPNDNAIKLGLVCLWFSLYEGILNKQEKRTLRYYINKSYLDGA